MAVFTDIEKLDLFLRMKVSGQDMNALSLLDFHPGGASSWKLTDGVSVTPGAKVIFRECMEGLVTVLGFIFSQVFEGARAQLISGLSAYSYNAMTHPDALVYFNYHNALVAFATIITTELGSAHRQLSGPEHTVKVLIDCFAHLTKDKWPPANRDFTEFNTSVFPVVFWPGSKSIATSSGAGKHKQDGGEESPSKKSKKVKSTFESRSAKRELAATTASNLSLNGLSLGGGGSTGGGAGAAAGIKTLEKRLCVAVLCNFAGVKYKGHVVKCNRVGGCGYTHPGNIDEVLKGDAANAIGRLKGRATDPETIAYMTEAEVFYAARAT